MSEERVKSVFILVGSILMVGFCLTPFVYIAITSLSESPDYLSREVTFKATIENYRSILTVPSLHFIDYVRNSFIISGVSALFCLFIAALGAYSITRLRLPGKIFILLFVLAISMFPQISLVGYLFRLMTRFGWINTYWALIFPYIAWTLPLTLWILVSYFAQIPRDLDKAALIDGCSRWQILHRVIFPVSAPGLFSALLIAFIFSFNEFMFALMLTIDHRARTVPVGIALFQGLHGEIPWGNIMAASTITTIPIIILTTLFQRHIIGGLTRGAVKG